MRFTYQHLLDLVSGDEELIVKLVEERLVERSGDVVRVDVDRVLLARTLWRDLDVDWPGIEIILELARQLGEARRRISSLEEELRKR